MSEFVSTSCEVEYFTYTDESMIPEIQKLVSNDLSEPYSIFTYRYFLHNWPEMCICGYAVCEDENGENRKQMIATIVCKADGPDEGMQGYIAMLAVDSRFRNLGIGTVLVKKGVEAMIRVGCREIVLETEVLKLILENITILFLKYSIPQLGE
jgi:N-alpha-acetyltransferase 30